MKTLLRWIRSGLPVCGVLLTAVSPGFCAQPTEYEVKAAFLVNFARYVQWPENAFAGIGQSFLVCVFGRDPFGKLLDEAFHDRRIHDRPVSVLRVQRLDAAVPCNLLFVAASESARIAAVLEMLGRSPVLTVADADAAAERGVMINLRLAEKKVRFDINPDAAEHAGLKLSSQLLKLARLVGRDGEAGK